METINVNAEALQYGYGIFETILVKNSEIMYFNEHFKRANSSLNYLNMKNIDRDDLLNATISYIKANNIIDGVLKICFYLVDGETKVAYYNREFPYSEEIYEAGYKLCVSSIKRHSKNPIHLIKSTNFINNYLEMQEIKDNNFNEAIHLNENDYITECIYSNIFFIKNNIVHTPCLDSGLLAGIMRQRVIDIVKKIGISIKIGYYSIEDLIEADEIFLTSSVLGIMRVSSFNNKVFDKHPMSLIDKLVEEI